MNYLQMEEILIFHEQRKEKETSVAGNEYFPTSFIRVQKRKTETQSLLDFREIFCKLRRSILPERMFYNTLYF